MILAVVRIAWVIQEVVSVLGTCVLFVHPDLRSIDTITMLSLLNPSRSALASDAAKTLTTVASIKVRFIPVEHLKIIMCSIDTAGCPNVIKGNYFSCT